MGVDPRRATGGRHVTFPVENDWRWPHFTPDEMRCKCGCGRLPDYSPFTPFADFMDWLEGVRVEYGERMTVSSGYRCPESDTSAKRHQVGAADVKVSHEDAHRLADIAFKRGVNGIGFNIKGRMGQRFIHLDRVRTGIWSYP